MKEDQSVSTKQYEEGPQRFEREFASRQSNVLPLDAARNEGRFYGSLFRGGRPLSASRRIGFVLLGLIACAQAFFVICSAFPGLAAAVGARIVPNSNRAVLLAYLPFALLFCLLGVKLIITAVAAPSRR
jgi:hypothetical protein